MNIRLIKSIDRLLGTALVKCLSAPGATSVSEPDSVLFIRPGGIGDAVLLIPAINALKGRFPRSEITVLAEKRNAAAFRLCPHIDKVLHYDKPGELLQAVRGRYDAVVDTEQWHRLSAVVSRLTRAPVAVGFAANERQKLFSHQVPYSHGDYEADSFMHLLEPFGIVRADGEFGVPFLEVPEAARMKARDLLGTLADKPYLTIFSGASIPERRWGAAKFAAVAERVTAGGVSVVVVGGAVDEADGDRITGNGKYGLNLAGRSSLLETSAILADSTVLLSGDSGVLHLGVGLGIPTVSLFGPGIAKKWAPGGDRHIVINRNLPCSPCTRFGYTPECPVNAECLRDITVDEVVAVVLRWF